MCVQVGENLTTFAIIPSRYDNNLSSSPVTTNSHQQVDYRASPASTNKVCNGRPTCQRVTMPTCVLGPRSVITESARSSFHCAHCSTASSSSITVPPSKENIFHGFHHRRLYNDARIAFCMSFEQPIADRETFQRHLDAQSVCLENVKVIDSSVCGASSTSSIDVLCTVKAKHPLPLDTYSSRRLFARWTNNEWLSHADITAQCITCGGLTGTTWRSTICVDTYSFAVQLHQPGWSPTSDSRSGHSAAYCGDGCSDCCHGNWLHSSAVIAVEFALCYIVDKATFWDNNDGRNYRIEWHRR